MYFMETPIGSSSLAGMTPQVDTTNIVIPPSLLDPQPQQRAQQPQPPLRKRESQITPIVEEPDAINSSLTPMASTLDLVAPSDYANSTNLDNTGILSLIKPKKASKPQKKSTSKSKPAFILKLWTMVNEPSNQELIKWCKDGKSFVVTNRENFVHEILPKYFKHSNFASFVRQLNMYGWHKVQDPSAGSLHSDDRWQFSNPNFQKDKPELLDKIVRNKPQEAEEEVETGTLNGLDIKLLLGELNSLKSTQLKITQELSRVRQDNDLLWQELYQTREQNHLQNEKVDKIFKFLSSIYGNSKMQLEDFDSQHREDQQVQPYVHSQAPYQEPMAMATQSPVIQKPRLMIKQHRHVSNPSSTAGNTPMEPRDGSISAASGSASTSLSSVPQQPSHLDGAGENSPVREIKRTQANTLRQPPPDYRHSTDDDVYQVPAPAQTPSLDIQTPRPQAAPPHANPSLDDLSRTIEQQGQSINDIISRLQNGTEYDQQPQAFDLDEFLNDDLLSRPDSTESKSSVESATTGEELKRGVDDDEIEEIINPSKKRKSGNVF
ncbi:Heat shock transcription factor [Cyberlindnera fabianii]|uniref:Heat shock transcription factor n=1 Tax=Cyberlindnera fabianii TaxID=36022 RepID=A0A1V2L674_CYBFA|nr:Heat shock transcription factor [Cyberlindnera fabianii]